MSITDLIKNGSKVSVTVSLDDLREFGAGLIDQAKRDLEQAVIDDKAEAYPTPKQVSQILGVDQVTLWRWAKRGYLVPVEMGGKRRYLMSEVKALLTHGKKRGVTK